MDGMVNYGILQPGIGNALAAGYQQAQDRQNALMQQQQQRQLGDIQLQNALREQRMAGEEEAAWKEGAGKPEQILQALQQRGLSKQATALQAQMSKQQADKLTMLKTANELKKQAATAVMANPTLETALGTVQAFAQQTGMDVSADIQALQATGGDPTKIRSWAAGHALEADKLRPQFQQFNVAGVGTKTGTVDPLTGQFVEGQTYREEVSPYQKEQLNISRGQLGVAQAGLALRREELARQRDPEFQRQMEYAKALGQNAAKGDIAAKQEFPKVIAQAQEAVGLINQMIGQRDAKGNLVKGAAPHPGFTGSVGAGIGLRFVPGTSEANFQALYDQVKSGAFLQAFNALRGAGAITEKEGEKATSAITRMSLAQDEKEFVKAALEFQDSVKAGAARAQQKVLGVGGTRPSTLSVSPNIDALLDKYK